MSEYEQKRAIQAPAEKVFDFVSDIGNLPKYLPTLHKATPQRGGERVRVQGYAGDRAYDADGYFHVNQEQLRMEWGSDGEMIYSGWMEVKSTGMTSSEVTVHLSFEPTPPLAEKMQTETGSRHRAILEGLEKTLVAIQNLVEGATPAATAASTV